MQRVASVLVRLGPWDIYTAKEVLIKRRIGWNQALPVDTLTSEFDVKIMFDVSFQKPLCQMTFGVFFFPAPGSMVGPLTPSAIVFAHCATRRKRQPRRGPKQPVVPMKPRKEVRWCKIRCFCWGKKWKKSLTCHWFVCSHGTTQQNSIYSIQSLSLVISLFGLHLWLGCQDLAIEVDYARLCISRLHLERVFVLFNLQCSWM